MKTHYPSSSKCRKLKCCHHTKSCVSRSVYDVLYTKSVACVLLILYSGEH